MKTKKEILIEFFKESSFRENISVKGNQYFNEVINEKVWSFTDNITYTERETSGNKKRINNKYGNLKFIKINFLFCYLDDLDDNLEFNKNKKLTQIKSFFEEDLSWKNLMIKIDLYYKLNNNLETKNNKLKINKI